MSGTGRQRHPAGAPSAVGPPRPRAGGAGGGAGPSAAGASAPPPAAVGAPIRLRGCAQFRQRVVFATLANKRLRIDDIRSSDESPGLRDFEASFLRLVEALTNGCAVAINDTGTCLRYSPGIITGGPVEHDCGTARSVGWFIEGVLPLLPFAKKPVTLALRGVTDDDGDAGADAVRLLHLPVLPHFGVTEGLKMDIVRRGMPPLGGGLVTLTCPVVRELK
jgi:RNA 3'-terminal phosphate cyclase-like protein